MVVAAFVAPYLLEATVRFVVAAAELPGVRLGLVTCEPVERIPPRLRERLDAHWRVDDALDPRQLAWAVKGLAGQLGRVERLVGALEQLQVPLAQVRESLGIDGMDVRTAVNVRDKSQMKETLRAAGIPCARHALVRSPGEALSFADEVGFPLVAKPPDAAAGGAANPLDPVDGRGAPRHLRPALRGHPPVGTGGAGGARRHRRAYAHGVVRPARRLGRRLGGGRAAARGAAEL